LVNDTTYYLDNYMYSVLYSWGQFELSKEVVMLATRTLGKGRGEVVVNLTLFRKERTRSRFMALIEITAKKEIGGVKKTATISYDFGENTQDAVKKFGDDTVFSNFRANAKITAQGAIRRMLEDKKTQVEITERMKVWKPGVALERIVDPVAALLGRWDSYTDQEKAEILKKLKTK
jgi:hypothetical protein